MDAIFYSLKTGCQWRMLPNNFTLWQSVYCYFYKWKNEGVIEERLECLFKLYEKMVKYDKNSAKSHF